MRHISTIDDGWTFTRESPATDTAWEAVTLPHAWNTSPDGVPTGVDDRGPGTYRRALTVPAATTGSRVFVEFGAAGTVAAVTCNGRSVGEHRGGYSAFRCELTDTLTSDGTGEIVVRVDNSPTDDVYPLMGDHTIFGGLYRGARLVVVDPVHIDLADHGGPGVIARQIELTDTTARIEVTVQAHNDGPDPAVAPVEVRIVDAEGNEVADARTDASIAAHRDTIVTLTCEIDRPRRWDGRRDPHCYMVTARLGDDDVTIPLGLREFRIDPDAGFVLNGRPYPLRGVSRHHDIDGTPAVTDAQIAADLDLIDEIGATAVRLAHYQHPETVLTECDRRGVVVWAEIPVNSQVSIADPTTNAESQLRELIAQQRHHPSIVCWGIQNETAIGEHAADPRPTTEHLAGLARELDPDRVTAQAQLMLVTPEDPINRLCDANAQNLYHGWYVGDTDGAGPALDRHRAANPDIPLGLSEYGADARPDFHAEAPAAGDYTEEYEAIFHEAYWATISGRPWLWATFVWNMFDFASVIRNEGGTRGFNMKGLVTRDRRVRKDAFWFYRSRWSDEPMLHICSKGFVHRAVDQIDVKVYSNAPSVTLRANGSEVGTVDSDTGIFTWKVDLADGENTIVAVAGSLRDEATFVRVDEPDPSYVCPNPRRVVSADRMDSWYEEAGITVDPTRFGTHSVLGDLLDDPRARSVLVDAFGTAMLEHPQLEIARGFTLDFVISAVAGDLSIEDRRRLHESLAAIDKPTD
ncbi:MAG: glycoside hydrolase family 2 protein [Actinobacteria bacterium]|nr:glycoside hydrolase family 2 protein [Actinomycetota bacterium]